MDNFEEALSQGKEETLHVSEARGTNENENETQTKLNQNNANDDDHDDDGQGKKEVGGEIDGIKEKEEPKEDLYFYTKSGDFTSELFKICVDNVPKYVGYQQLKKAFEKVNVDARKIKIDSHSGCAYLTFRSEEEREAAIQTLTGFTLKKSILTAKKAKPKADPLLQKRQRQQQDGVHSKKSRKENSGENSVIDQNLPPEKRVARVVTELYDMPYNEQLKIKEDAVKIILKRLTTDLLSTNTGAWVREQMIGDTKICCTLENIIPSPILQNYRNKVEYNIGPGADDEGTTVGFRLGTYKDDNFAVVSPSECINVSKEAKYIAKIFQDFIRKSDKACYDPGKHTGYWRQLTVRSCSSGDVMVIVQIHPQQMTESEISSLKVSLRDLFFEESNEVKVTSLYLQKVGQRQSGENVSETYEHIDGSMTIQESMLNMKFRISPDAFFQVNTPAAEALYSKVGELCETTENTTVLDVCCGTGTIGLAIAKRDVKKVIGIEMCQQAVDDAKHNAEINGVTNAEYICGKAEDFLYNVTKELSTSDVVAVVDPPRAGLHKKVILALRQCRAIKRLIYVSCNPKQAATNFLDLCRPTTNRNKGHPFRLLKAIPVDLFPHTRHYELILLMERNSKETQIESKKVDSAIDESVKTDEKSEEKFVIEVDNIDSCESAVEQSK